MSEAGMAGAKMIPHQRSYESPPLLMLLSAFFQDKNLDELTTDVRNGKKVGVK
jgi:hypothetical protein